MYDFAWLQSKVGAEIMTASSDGQVLWWDVRRMGQPLESLQLRVRVRQGWRGLNSWVQILGAACLRAILQGALGVDASTG